MAKEKRISPDTARGMEQAVGELVSAINTRDAKALRDILSRQVRMRSDQAREPLRGRMLVTRHFEGVFRTVQGKEDMQFAAARGMLKTSGAEAEPCAVVYDGAEPACVIRVGLSKTGRISRIEMIADRETVDTVQRIEAPPFRDRALVMQTA